MLFRRATTLPTVISRKFKETAETIKLLKACREQQITDQIQVLNDAFNATGITFELVNTTYVTNADWFANASPFEYAFPFVSSCHKLKLCV